jgi:hypothetical protein
MQPKPPIALIVFSNDLDNFLSNIERERKIIEEALEQYHDTNRLRIITRSSVTLPELFRLFRRYKGRIVLFHFAGHAGGAGLQLNDDALNPEMGRAEGLAGLFKQEVEQGILQFVFLNGCSTMPQVEGLQAAGVPSIIATHCPINDNKAITFAREIYRSLANTEHSEPFNNLTTIQEAFDNGLNFLNGKEKFTAEKTRKGLKIRRDKKEYNAPWTFFTENPDWTLPTKQGETHRALNEELFKRLMHAIAPYQPKAKEFLEKVEERYPEWETMTNIRTKASNLVVRSYVGILSIKLRKLMAIGLGSEANKEQKYIDCSYWTAKRTLKIVCFSMLSKLWDIQKQQPISLETNEQRSIQEFFDDFVDFDISRYWAFTIILVQIFQKHQKAFPFGEITELIPQLTTDSYLKEAFDKLQLIQHQSERQHEYTLARCYQAERHLATILEYFAFLADYKMVSIKGISYEEVGNQSPKYIHRFATLGHDKELNKNKEGVNYAENPVNTDAILLYKGRYQESINLFPFIIDYNALTFEDNVLICLYSSKNMDTGSLDFRILEDNKIKSIKYSGTLAEAKDINETLMNIDNHKLAKLDMVYEQFEAVKKAILNNSSNGSDEEIEDDLDAFLDDL